MSESKKRQLPLFVSTRRQKRHRMMEQKDTEPSRRAPKKNGSNSVAKIFEMQKLFNIGNSCFMNSLFQSLATLDGFTSRLRQVSSLLNENHMRRMNEEGQKQCELIKILCQILHTITPHGKTDNLPPVTRAMLKNVRETVGSVYPDFNNESQQDPHELLCLLLARMEKTIKSYAMMFLSGNIPNQSKTFGYSEILHSSSFLNINPTEEFKFYSEIRFICSNCEDSRTQIDDSRMHLNLPISDQIGIQESFNGAFITFENDDVRCQECGGKGALVSSRINIFPQSFVITLERYLLEGDVAKKVEAKVPLTKYLYTNCVAKFQEQTSEDSEEKIEVVRDRVEESLVIDRHDDGKDSTVLRDTFNESSSLQILDEKISTTIPFHPLCNIAEIRKMLGVVDLKPVNNSLKKHLAQFRNNMVEVEVTLAPKLIQNVRGDGNCFYRAVSWLLMGSEDHYKTLRKKNTELIANNTAIFSTITSEPIAKIVEKAQKDCSWASEVEIIGMCTLLQIDIYTYLSGKWVRYQPKWITGQRKPGCFYLNNRNNVHFEPVIDVFELSNDRLPKRDAPIVDGDGSGVVKRRSPRLLGGFDEFEENAERKVEVEKLVDIGRKESSREDIDWEMAKNSPVYALRAMVCHHGATPNSGHYTAYTRNGSTGEWLYCSDTVIYPVPKEEAMSKGSSHGYLIFYAKIQQ